MKITFVKKILKNGEPCPKCADVEKRLEDSAYVDLLDEIVVADERDPNSPGMVLASTHNVNLAPFFVVEDNEQVRIYTVYFKFVREVFGATERATAQDAEDRMRANRDLDFI